jgi:hypothetical protein
MVEMKLEISIAVNTNPARIVIAQGKVPNYDMSAVGRTRRGEGGKDSTLNAAKAIAEYASS